MNFQEGGLACVQRPETDPLAHCSILTKPCSFPTQALYASCPSLLAQEYKVMTEIMLLQVAAGNYNLQPKDPCRASFKSMEWLNKDEK